MLSFFKLNILVKRASLQGLRRKIKFINICSKMIFAHC